MKKQKKQDIVEEKSNAKKLEKITNFFKKSVDKEQGTVLRYASTRESERGGSEAEGRETAGEAERKRARKKVKKVLDKAIEM